MRELILLLLLLLSSCLGVRTESLPGASVPPRPPAQPPVPPAPPASTHELLVVEYVDALVLESYPMQLRLAVRGYWPSGCNADVQVEQQLEGDMVTVTIWRELPVGAVCPAVIVPYDETIAIEGGFTRLPSAITVNGWTQRLN